MVWYDVYVFVSLLLSLYCLEQSFFLLFEEILLLHAEGVVIFVLFGHHFGVVALL